MLSVCLSVRLDVNQRGTSCTQRLVILRVQSCLCSNPLRFCLLVSVYLFVYVDYAACDNTNY